MKTYLVTLNFGQDRLAPASRASMQSAAQRWRAELVEIRLSPWPSYSGQLHLNRLVPAEGRIVYMDRDIVIRDDCPDLFEIVPAGHFGYVSEDQGPFPDDVRAQFHAAPFDRWTQALGGRERFSKAKYFNAGMTVFDMPEHGKVYARASDAVRAQTSDVTWFDCQGSIAASANLGDIPVHPLAKEFNLLYTHNTLAFAPDVMSAYVYHFNHGSPGHKLALAARTRWQTTNPWVPPVDGSPLDRPVRYRRRIRRPLE